MGLIGCERDVDLPLLKSIKLNDNAFSNSQSFELMGLSSLESLEMGNGCFSSLPSLSLHGIQLLLIILSDLPKLQSIKLNDKAFSNSQSVELAELPSLKSIEMRNGCFSSVPSFAING